MTVSTPFGPVERRTVADEIRERITDSIRSGELQAGQRLPAERQLCEQFQVARTSVREAIQGLVSVGYLERRGNRPYVAERLPEVDLDDDGRKRTVRELFETRRVIELQLAELACERATPAQRDRISEIADGFRSDLPLDDFRRQDQAFHSAIAEACGNSLLTELYSKVCTRCSSPRRSRRCSSPGPTGPRCRPSSPAPAASTRPSPPPSGPGTRWPWSPRPRSTCPTSSTAC